jgi:hypothetical protein
MLTAPAPLIVLGDSPWLQSFDLARMSNVHTIGMGSGCRHWRTMGWYPTYYCCLDPESIHSHADAIARLVEERRIRRFLLAASVLDLVPEIANSPSVEFVDEYVTYWREAVGRRHGLCRRDSVFFETRHPEKLTTASCAVRWGLALGYRRIGLLGVDCRPVIPAHSAAGAERDASPVMATTPGERPNHPSGGHRVAWDLLDGINPQSHGRHLELQSFEARRLVYGGALWRRALGIQWTARVDRAGIEDHHGLTHLAARARVVSYPGGAWNSLVQADHGTLRRHPDRSEQKWQRARKLCSQAHGVGGFWIGAKTGCPLSTSVMDLSATDFICRGLSLPNAGG